MYAGFIPELKCKTESEWVTDLVQITNPLIRAQVASIIWWDYSPYKPDAPIWATVATMRDTWPIGANPNMDKVRVALVAVGYPDAVAKERCEAKRYDGRLDPARRK